MDDFIGVRGVIDPARLAVLAERRNRPGLAYLASHWGAIAANSAAMAWTWGTVWCVAFFVFQGLLINYLYAPQHECDHRTAFRSRWLNHVVGWVCGFAIFNPSAYHRLSHFTHHRHTQDWEKDPELGRGPVSNAWQYLRHLSGMPLLRGRIRVLVRYVAGGPGEWYMTEGQRRTVVHHVRWHVAGYAAVAGCALLMQSWWPLYYWVGPFVLMRWSYHLQGLGEHLGLTHSANTLLNTRTYRTNAFMRWVNWNMSYHAVHHTYPSVPFHRLPALQREVEQRVGFELPSASHLALHWRHLRALCSGRTELDLCAAHDVQLVAEGKLSAPAP